MKPAELLKRLKELREIYRKQSFSFSKEQQEEYNNLRQLRYERVNYFHKNGLVYKGASKKTVEVSK